MILINSKPKDTTIIQNLFSNGSPWGIEFSYAEQPNSDGVAQAFLIGESFPVTLRLP